MPAPSNASELAPHRHALDPETWRALLCPRTRGRRRGTCDDARRELGRLARSLEAAGKSINDVSIDGSSLLAHTLAHARWLTPALMALGARPRAGEPFFVHILKRFPDRWKMAWPLRVGPDARDEEGEAPLHVAAQLARPSLVSLLLSSGVFPEVQDRCGHTPLAHVWNGASAARDEAVEVARCLLTAGARWDTSLPAAMAQTGSPFHALVETFPHRATPPDLDFATAGTAVNTRNSAGVLPLSQVVRTCHQVFRDLEQRLSTKPLSPLALWELKQQQPVSPRPWVRWLRSLGANPFLKNADGTTPAEDFEGWRRAVLAEPVTHKNPTESLWKAMGVMLAQTEPVWRELELRVTLPETGESAPSRSPVPPRNRL